MRPDKRFYEILGKNVKLARMEKGISLRRLSELLHGKYGASTLSRYERGDQNLELSLDEICGAIGADANEIWNASEAERSGARYWDQETIDFADAYKLLSPRERDKVNSFIGFVKSEK